MAEIKTNKIAINDLPSTNGIYIFKSGKTPIYIGKSVNIKARVKSHFENAKKDEKERAIIENADKLDHIITDSEFKALILESKLIQKYLPKYNVQWRDDKSYLYIKATLSEKYPKFFITRREEDKKSKYFGPFPSVKIAESLLNEIRKSFPFCTQKRITKQRCFYSKIHLCDPCPNEIEKISDEVMRSAKIKEYRSNIRNTLKVLDGKIEPIVRKLTNKIKAFTLKEQFEKAIPFRNKLINLEDMVLRRRFGSSPDEYNQSESRLLSLHKLLLHYFKDLEDLSRIECYDMSTLTFQDSTASMIVFVNGLSDKKEYRKFKISNEKIESDFQMFEEVVRRRFRNKWEHPKLIVVDGGKPQVRTVLRILKSLQLEIPLIGIAKRPDRLIIGQKNFPSLRPPRNHPGFRLVQSMRDESHRFAKKYHLFLRHKSSGIL